MVLNSRAQLYTCHSLARAHTRTHARNANNFMRMSYRVVEPRACAQHSTWWNYRVIAHWHITSDGGAGAMGRRASCLFRVHWPNRVCATVRLVNTLQRNWIRSLLINGIATASRVRLVGAQCHQQWCKRGVRPLFMDVIRLFKYWWNLFGLIAI